MADYYWTLRHIHITAVALSLSLFVLRGLWMLADSPRLRQPWARVAPHVIDTVLLASAVALTLIIHQYPFVDAWLTAKVLGLLAYIGLGTVALKRGRRKRVRMTAFLGALLVFGYMVGAALRHSPWGWIG